MPMRRRAFTEAERSPTVCKVDKDDSSAALNAVFDFGLNLVQCQACVVLDHPIIAPCREHGIHENGGRCLDPNPGIARPPTSFTGPNGCSFLERAHFPELIVLKRLLDFGAAAHHEGTLTHDGFMDRLAGKEQ